MMMETDTLDYALAECLSQRDLNSELIRLMTFYSQKLIKSEQNQEIYDKKMIVIVVSLKKWQPQLEEIFRSFTVSTDHKNLEYFKILKVFNKQQAQWKEMLNFYNFIIKYQVRIMNHRADVLFRQTDYHLNKNTDNKQSFASLLEADWLTFIEADYLILIYSHKNDCLMLTDDWMKALKVSYKINSKIKKLLQQIKRSEKYHINYNINEFRLIQKDSLLYISDIVKLKKETLQTVHDALLADYIEIQRILILIRQTYYFSDMYHFIKRYVRFCEVCLKIKAVH